MLLKLFYGPCLDTLRSFNEDGINRPLPEMRVKIISAYATDVYWIFFSPAVMGRGSIV